MTDQGPADKTAERRDVDAPGDRLLGHVVACSGARATVAAIIENGATDLTERWSVGRLISISVGRNRVVALVDSMQTDNKAWVPGVNNVFRVEVELMGEVVVDDDGSETFSTGISSYPHLGAIAHRIRKDDLKRIYKTRNGESRPSASCRRTRASMQRCISPQCCRNTSPLSARPASANPPRCRFSCARPSRLTRSCACSSSIRITNSPPPSTICLSSSIPNGSICRSG